MKNQKLLDKIHILEFEALQQLDNICKNNDCKYFLRGGSALGAVKYSGFVPWDDDIDVALPRKDYKKLINIMPTEFSDKFIFVSYQKVENSHCYFPRVLLRDDIRKKFKLPKNNERGLLLIDILPIDGMPESSIAMKLHIYKAYFYRALASLWTIDIKDTVNMHQGKQQQILNILHSLKIHHLYKQDNIYRHLDQMYSKYQFGKTTNAGMLASSKLKKEIVPTNTWGDGTKMKFNGLDVLVPSNYDDYLQRLFGKDYANREPSESERKKSHLSGIN